MNVTILCATYDRRAALMLELAGYRLDRWTRCYIGFTRVAAQVEWQQIMRRKLDLELRMSLDR